MKSADKPQEADGGCAYSDMTDVAWPPPVVDAHAHVFTQSMPLAAGAWNRPGYDFSVERYLELLDAQGIAFGVLSATSLFDDDNEYTLSALRRFKRLRATVNVQPGIGRAKLVALAAQGVVGVRLQWRNLQSLPDIESSRYRALLRDLADAGLHVQLLARGEHMPQLLPAIAAQGGMLVLDHFADPDRVRGVDSPGFQAVLRAIENGRTFVKLSAVNRLPFALARACAERLLTAAGPERLLWGSDAPFVGHEADMTYADALRTFEALVPDARQRHAISQTALRQFFF